MQAVGAERRLFRILDGAPSPHSFASATITRTQPPSGVLKAQSEQPQPLVPSCLSPSSEWSCARPGGGYGMGRSGEGGSGQRTEDGG